MATRDVTAYLEDSLLKSEMYFRYYGAVAHTNRQWHLGLSVGVIVGSISAGTLLLAPETPTFTTWASAGLFFLVALMSTLMVVLDFSGRAHVAETTSESIYSIGVELHHLWYSEHDDAMLETLMSLERKIDEACRNDLGGRRELIERCNQEAFDMLQSYYPTFSTRKRTGDRHKIGPASTSEA